METKNKNKKRGFALIFLVLIFTGIFAGCSEAEIKESIELLSDANLSGNSTIEEVANELTGNFNNNEDSSSEGDITVNNQNNMNNMNGVNSDTNVNTGAQQNAMMMGGQMSGMNGAGGTSSFEVADFEAIDLSDLKIEDVDSDYDADDAIYIEFDDDEITVTDGDDGVEIDDTVLNIVEGGVYVLSGELNDGSVVIETEDEVQLVLDGVTIYSTESSAIVVENADKLIITLEDGSENYLYDSSEYEDPDEVDDATPGVIYSKDDLYINGEGSLTITSYEKSGIQSKDQIVIVSGEVSIDVAKDGIKGKDFVLIEDGYISIVADEDGITSTEDEEGKGYVIVNGGEISVESGKDGIHSENSIVINDGDLVIDAEDDGIDADIAVEINGGDIVIEDSYEGIEATNIYVLDGEISIVASDDGINVASSEDVQGMQGATENVIDGALYVYGGYIYIVSEGDSLDSNGNIYMNGGTIVVNGPTTDREGGIDYNGAFIIEGGTLAVSGSSGMAETVSSTSTQNTVMITFDETINAGDVVAILDSSENEVIAFEASKSYQNLVLSSELFEDDETYTVYVDADISGSDLDGLYLDFTFSDGEEYDSFTASSVSSTIGSAGGMNMGGGMRGGMMPTDMSGEMGEMPEGFDDTMNGERPQRGMGGPGGMR